MPCTSVCGSRENAREQYQKHSRFSVISLAAPIFDQLMETEAKDDSLSRALTNESKQIKEDKLVLKSVFQHLEYVVTPSSSFRVVKRVNSIVEATVALQQCVRENTSLRNWTIWFRFEGNKHMELLRCQKDKGCAPADVYLSAY